MRLLPTRMAVIRYRVPPNQHIRVEPAEGAPIDLRPGDRIEIPTEDAGVYLIRFDRKPIPQPSDAEMVAHVREALLGFSRVSNPSSTVMLEVLRRAVGLDRPPFSALSKDWP